MTRVCHVSSHLVTTSRHLSTLSPGRPLHLLQQTSQVFHAFGLQRLQCFSCILLTRKPNTNLKVPWEPSYNYLKWEVGTSPQVHKSTPATCIMIFKTLLPTFDVFSSCDDVSCSVIFQTIETCEIINTCFNRLL